MAEFEQSKIEIVKEGDLVHGVDRAFIRNYVKQIHAIAQNLDTMMELEDRKNPDSVIALKAKEENEIYSLFDEVSKLSKYLVYHGVWKENYNGLCAEEKKKIKQAYEQGYAQAKHDDEVSRSWEENYRQSQMPWNHYTEMGG